MPLTIEWEGNETATVDYNPFAPKYQDPPTPPVFSYDSGYRRGNPRIRDRMFQGLGDAKAWDKWIKRRNKMRENPPEEPEEGPTGVIGYETDWKYPSWLIRMAQWRNF